MNINNFSWWLIIILGLISYFIFRYGMTSRGNLKEIISFLGGILLLLSFILMFLLFGIKSGVIYILIFWVVITPINEIILQKVRNKIDKPYDKRNL